MKTILNKIKEVVESLKKDVPSEADDSFWPIKVDGYNAALSDLITHLTANKQI